MVWVQKSGKRQRGMVLVVALVFLLILTVAGLSAMRLANLEERLSGNVGDRQVAFQAAEAALVEGESYLLTKDFSHQNFFSVGCSASLCFDSTGTDGLFFTGSYEPNQDCDLDTSVADAEEVFQDETVWEDSARYRPVSVSIQGVSVEARYIIEFRCFAVRNPENIPEDQYDDSNKYSQAYWEPLYRVTALAWGRTEKTRVMLQSTYRRD